MAPGQERHRVQPSRVRKLLSRDAGNWDEKFVQRFLKRLFKAVCLMRCMI